MEKLKIGVSACLLGQNVRYNGGHQLNHFIRDILGQYMDFVPVCPEVECGMPIPRETLRLVGNENAPRLVTSRSGVDHTEQMQSWAEKKVKQLEQEELCGFIFKKDSPSSGLYRVKVYSEQGMPRNVRTGIFARAFTRHFPLLPVEEEGRLNDGRLRENFIESVFVFKHFRDLIKATPSRGGLVDFHTRHKFILLAHDEPAYRALGRLVAQAGARDIPGLGREYLGAMMAALKKPARAGSHTNVLQHIYGFVKDKLDAEDRRELLEVFEEYRCGRIPLIVPLTLLRHHLRRHPDGYIERQYYLDPHPRELMLRNLI